ncbi:MAG: hypothetical protein COA84_03820 [Robiginitomaculum sp.]|nr:MAG: hypothetical protein COA84_03820 [Robiginitomaculum sp.]
MFKKYALLLAIPAILIALPLVRSLGGSAEASDAPDAATVAAEQPVIAAMFYSNWCGACQILDPKIEAVKPNFSGHKVDFVKFDFSYALVRGKALKDLAAEKGVPNIYAKNKGRTGFMLLIDPATETVLDIITMRDNKEAIAAKLDRSLNRAAPDAAPVSASEQVGQSKV